MNRILQDLRYAVRMLAKNPGFTVLAVLLLGVGIGVSSTAFSVIDSLFLRSLPVAAPERLVKLSAAKKHEHRDFSHPDYLDICRQSKSFAGVLASSRGGAELNQNGETELVMAERISDNYFAVLGIKSGSGEAIALMSVPGATPQVVLGYGLWQRLFGADPAIVGKTIIVNRRTAVVSGVAPSSFKGISAPLTTEIWLPFGAWGGVSQKRDDDDFENLLGRLRPGVEMAQVRAELETIAHSLALAYPASNKEVTYTAELLKKPLLKSLILAAVLLSGPILVLVICSANISGMMLARAEERRNEIAVRLALGSGRGRLLRQLLTESLLFSFLGSGLGLLFTYWLVSLQPVLMPPMPATLRIDVRVDLRVALFTLTVGVAASLISGLAPAFHAAKAELTTLLNGRTSRTEVKAFGMGLRSMLVIGQVALSLMLLICTGLFLKSLVYSQRIDPGFDSRKKLLIVNVAPFMNPMESSQRFFFPLIEQIRVLPGVKNVTYALRMPLSASGAGVTSRLSIPGLAPPAGQKGFTVKYNSVGRDYFATVGTRVLRGRAFNRYDELANQRTAIVSETMAKQFWRGVDPIGAAVTLKGRNHQIVGIAQDSTTGKIHEAPLPYIYFPFTQVPSGESSIIVETSGDPAALANAVSTRIKAADKSVLMQKPITLEDVMALALFEERFLAGAAGALGVLGIGLSAIGLYAVLAYLARRKTHEIGVRIALGARRQDISWSIVRNGFRISLIGVVAGLVISWLSMAWLASVLHGVDPADRGIYAAASGVVLGISVLASYLPARRAAGTDPIVALRFE